MKEILLDNQKIVKKIIVFLREEFKKRKKVEAILGISGGIDSTTSAVLCKKAKLKLYGVILPYKKRGENFAKRAISFLKLPKNRIINIDITQLVEAQVEKLQRIVKLDRIDKGNIMARQRMIIQYALARKFNGLVVGTENLSEYYLGYFTLHGDGAYDINPIGGLFKTQVYELAKYLGVPEWILERKPSADLWLGQTDEKELGFSYKEADPILYFYCIKNYSEEKIIKKGFNPKLVSKVLARVKATEFKRQGQLKILFNYE